MNAKFQGYNGSQSCDTSFAIQAIISTDLVEEYGPTLRKAHTFMKDSQVRPLFISIYVSPFPYISTFLSRVLVFIARFFLLHKGVR